jgi:phage-related protein
VFFWAALRDFISGALSGIRDLFVWFGALFVNAWTAMFTAIRGVTTWVFTITKNFIRDTLDAILGWFLDLPGEIEDALASLADIAYDAGRAMVQGLIDGINSLIGSIPDLTPGFDIPGVPGLAHGVTGFQGGLAVVGELGPELVRLPRGADVTPSNASSSAAGGITQNFYVEDRSPTALAHAVEMAGLELGERLAEEGV